MKEPGTAYADPLLGSDPQPAHMEEYVSTFKDNGGVHINSGIPNKAFYATAIEIGGYAWEKAGKIWYSAMCDKLPSDADFQEAANVTYDIAKKLYGKNSNEHCAVAKGWETVGITVESDKLLGCNLFSRKSK
jgi:Zn-dependent metalloprotease